MAAAGPRPSRLQVWRMAARPATLPAAVGPVLVGLGVAFGSGAAFRADTAAGCLAVSLLLQVAANFANDLADNRRGADTPDRQGPVRVAAAGLLTDRQIEAGIAAVVGVAAVIGLYLAYVGGPVMLVLGAAAVVALLAYTGGPWPYGYKGLGEVFVFAFFGLMATGVTAYLQSGDVRAAYLLAACPIGALVTAILIVNNLRDIPTDRAAGKRTLAVMFGERFAKWEFYATLAVAAVVPPAMLLAGMARPAVLVAIAALVLAPPLVGEVSATHEAPAWEVGADAPGTDRRRLNRVLKGTARLSLVYGVLFAIGLAVR
jgi:1,4-dihydroxy-2-naphthoate polyprenyltransferase